MSVIAARTREPVILLNSNNGATGTPSLLLPTAPALHQLFKDHRTQTTKSLLHMHHVKEPLVIQHTSEFSHFSEKSKNKNT